MYFPEEIINKLQSMFTHEIHNSLLYQKISHELGNMGYNNLSEYYAKWSEEELSKIYTIVLKCV
jgi:ferritin